MVAEVRILFDNKHNFVTSKSSREEAEGKNLVKYTSKSNGEMKQIGNKE